VSLGDYQGRNVVVYFYPRDSTPGCTIEAHDFSALLADFAARNAVVIGISTDSVASHCDFSAKENLKVTLLSDPQHATIEAYGAWQEKSIMGRLGFATMRTTVLVGPGGRVSRVWERVKAAGHAAEVLAALS
jgi:peroxiredoxin Q/BCP